MKRRTQFHPGNFYHIYNRGANRDAIFREHDNYLFLLRRLSRIATEKPISIIAYCLMPNHYHFLLRQNGEFSIGAFMQNLFNSYSKAFNKMYGRTGTLFEGPFKSIHVDKSNYLIYLCRYIHRNPKEACLVSNLSDWPYSNYLEWIEKRNGKLIDRAFVKANFKSPAEYEKFVEESEHKPPDAGEFKKYIG